MPLPSEALLPTLQLALVPGVGARRLNALLHIFGSPQGVLGAPASEIQSLTGSKPELARRIGGANSSETRAHALAILERLHRFGGVAMVSSDEEFPDAFRELVDPPPLLFACGNLELLTGPGIAIVGTRHPSEYGRRAASQLAADLARAGLIIVSGMARGIDAAAHSAALDAGGPTVGVLGHGIDRVYPACNRSLFGRVREEGLLISEFLPGEHPHAGNFPRRNRLIAALSRGTLVVEMSVKSGAQHTVSYALNQGKDVFAVPGPIGAPMSEGTNQLIKEGACVVTSAADVLAELAGARDLVLRPLAPIATPAPEPVETTGEEDQVLAHVGAAPLHVDELAERCGIPTSELLSRLLTLEMKGSIEALPGKRFHRTSTLNLTG
ncbi:MAG TPA: DNA-processing protein DprA [Longimicrobiaceae bacterium]|nr:DNA-processing protein DprA [Longimicrobiaceae bacterium]